MANKNVILADENDVELYPTGARIYYQYIEL